jgi:uncharacterized protein
MTEADARIVSAVARDLDVPPLKARAVADLLDEGATVPFIARYRKEATGGMDEVAIIALRDGVQRRRELEKRRKAVLESIASQGSLTEGLQKQIWAADTMARLEDLYLPYKPRRETRGDRARKQGLEKLAVIIARAESGDPETLAAAFVRNDDAPADVHEALAGAGDIIAEDISRDPDLRHALRILFREGGVISSRAVVKKSGEDGAAVYRDYFDHSEDLRRLKGHRLLAMLRGQREGFLRLRLEPAEEQALKLISKIRYRGHSDEMMRRPCGRLLAAAIADSYKRLIRPSLETELLASLRERAETEAIDVFAENLRQLLLSPPMGARITLGLDPGLRTGCKLAVVGREGELLEHSVIYPLEPRRDEEGASRVLRELVGKYGIEAVAVGNGTGGREALAFVKSLALPGVLSVPVSESGASVYSASEEARREFPDLDLTVRGAVSIARRLVDPLSELVKVDPRSIGVGQYQHDVDQKELRARLDDVVSSCVNAVGVDLNTASEALLSYISGLSRRLAEAIVKHRQRNGAFASRTELRDLPGMGAKTFQQSAGFLRISGGPYPLDASAVHPERYNLVERMARDAGCGLGELMADEARRARINLQEYMDDQVGLPTLNDIMAELAKPGRDPREDFEEFSFSEDVHVLEDVKPGMRLPGIVTNITKFGAFVDLGVHQDGLIHISQLADRFVNDPGEVVHLGQPLTVKVIEVDLGRRRIALSLKES